MQKEGKPKERQAEKEKGRERRNVHLDNKETIPADIRKRRESCMQQVIKGDNEMK